ncbi:hypothetical protein RUND412_001508 [Rhizina undulata]
MSESTAIFAWNQKAALVAQLVLKWKDEKGKEQCYEGPKQSAPTECELDLIKDAKIPEGTKDVVVGARCVAAADPDDCDRTFEVRKGHKVAYGLFGTIFHKWIEFIPGDSQETAGVV